MATDGEICRWKKRKKNSSFLFIICAEVQQLAGRLISSFEDTKSKDKREAGKYRRGWNMEAMRRAPGFPQYHRIRRIIYLFIFLSLPLTSTVGCWFRGGADIFSLPFLCCNYYRHAVHPCNILTSGCLWWHAHAVAFTCFFFFHLLFDSLCHWPPKNSD